MLDIGLALIAAGIVAIAWALSGPEGRELIEEMRGVHAQPNATEMDEDHA